MSLDTDASAISADVTPKCIALYLPVAANASHETYLLAIF